LFLNNGAGGFGRNLFTVSFLRSTVDEPNLGLSNEMRFVGDLTGDGRVDFFFQSWSGFGAMCVNQGVPLTPTGPARAFCASTRQTVWRSRTSMVTARSMS